MAEAAETLVKEENVRALLHLSESAIRGDVAALILIGIYVDSLSDKAAREYAVAGFLLAATMKQDADT